MRRWATGELLAVLAATLALVAGCGGSASHNAGVDASKRSLASSIASQASVDAARRSAPPPAPVDEPYRHSVDTLCQQVLTYNTAHPNPYPDLNLLSPDSATLAKLGTYYAASPYEKVLAAIIRRPAPTTHPETWSAFVTTAAELQRQTLAQIAAARRGDVAAFVATLTPVQSAQVRVSDAAHQTGFAAPESCDSLFRIS